MQIAKRWEEVSVRQFEDFMSIETDSILDKYCQTLLSLSDIEPEELEELTGPEIVRLVSSLKFLKQPIRGKSKTKIKTEKHELKRIEFSRIKLGEFIDLEYFIQEGWTSLETVLNILFRRFRLNEWSDEVLEPYEFNPSKVDRGLGEVSIVQVFSVYKDFLKWKKDLLKTYENLFIFENEEDEDEEEEESDKETASKKWSWESMILIVCNNDRTKFKDVLDMNVIFFFNTLSMTAEKRS